MAHGVKAPPPAGPASAPIVTVAEETLPRVVVADAPPRPAATPETRPPPPPQVRPRGSVRYFAKATVRPDKVTVLFERAGRTYTVSLNRPTDANPMERGRFAAGALQGDFETRLLDDGAVFFHLLIDGTGRTTLPSGESVSFREGTVGFCDRGGATVFQASLGRHIDGSRPVHTPPAELYEISRELQEIADGRLPRSGKLDFLADETDWGLLVSTVRFVLRVAEEKKSEGLGVVLAPVFANPQLNRAQQREILTDLVALSKTRLLSEVYHFLPRATRTLASLEAIHDLALDLTGPAYQSDASQSPEARVTAYMRGIELLGFLSPSKADASLPPGDLEWAIDLCLGALSRDQPTQRLAAYKSLELLLGAPGDFLARRILDGFLARKKEGKSGPDAETMEVVAEARATFLAHALTATRPLGYPPETIDPFWRSLTKQLEDTVVMYRALVRALEALEALPPGEVPYSKNVEDFVRALVKRMRTTSPDLLAPFEPDHWSQLAVHVRERPPLYALVRKEDPEWEKRLAGPDQMRIRLRHGMPRVSGGKGDAWISAGAVLTLDDAKRFLGLDGRGRGRRDPFFDRMERPSDEFERAVEMREWKEADRSEVLKLLLERTAVQSRGSYLRGGVSWARVSYLFAERYGLKADYLAWMDEQWSKHHDPVLIFSVGRGDRFERQGDVDARLASYGREMLSKPDGISDRNSLEALRALVDLETLPEGDGTFFRDRLLDRTLDLSTIGEERAFYSVHLRLNDLAGMMRNGELPEGRYEKVAAFYTRAFEVEPTPTGLYPAAQGFQAKAKGAGKKIPRLDEALKDFAYLGQYPAEATLSAQKFYQTVTSAADRDERREAAEEAKFIVLNRRFLRELFKGREFDPTKVRDLQLLERGLGIAMHDSSGRVAEEAGRSYAYAIAVLAPSREPGGELEPILIVRDRLPEGTRHKKSDWRVFALNVDGEISDRSIGVAREALTQLPRQLTARFLSVEGRRRDPQRHSPGLRELVHPEGGGKGRPIRYTMQLYAEIDLDTAVHAVMHPVWDSLPPEDQRRFVGLHNNSHDPVDFAEEYGRTDPMEDLTTIGNFWARNSERALKVATELALKGHPVFLQKLLIFLATYSAGEEGIPAHQFVDGYPNARIKNGSFTARRDSLGQIVGMTTPSGTFSFTYSDGRLVSMNGTDLSTLSPVPVKAADYFPPSLVGVPAYHP